jgi:microsomal epoxide hydrolase
MRTGFIAILLYFLSSGNAHAQVAKNAFLKTSDHVSIHYVEAGNGRAIVFIPGWTMPAWIWQKQIDNSRKSTM